jgi:hypothetical protein
MRTASLVAMVMLAAGCAASPFADRTVNDRQFSFAYGRYCGPGYPPVLPDKGSEPGLQPLDDIDAACYSHDHCYALVADADRRCDMALIHLFQQRFQPSMRGSNCWSLVHEIVNAFFVKPCKRGEGPAGTISSCLVDGTLGLAGGSIMQLLKAPITLFESPVEEGTCNIGPRADPIRIVAEYEAAYAIEARGTSRPAVAIPLPR